MSFRTNLLKRVDQIRGQVPGKLDLRPYSVIVRVRTWTGARPGLGTKTDVDTQILNAGFNPKVEEVSSRDIIASGNVYQMGDYKISPITPDYGSGGTPGTSLDPSVTTTALEVFYKISGPRLPSSGAWFKRVSSSDLTNFHIEVVVRSTAVTP